MFSNYNNIVYPFNIKGETVYKVLKDITTNARIRRDSLDNTSLYMMYYMRDGDTPEIIAKKYYDNEDLYYLVMLANDRYDWRVDYPLTQMELDYYIRTKYVEPEGIHHYEDEYGNILDNIVRQDIAGNTYLLMAMPDHVYETKDGDIIEFVKSRFGEKYVIDSETTMGECPCMMDITPSATRIELTEDVIEALNTEFGLNLELPNRRYVDSEHTIPVTNMEYEERENEQKRHIRLIEKSYADAFVRALDAAIEENE